MKKLPWLITLLVMTVICLAAASVIDIAQVTRFYIIGGAVVISLVSIVFIYRSIIRPMQTLSTGVGLLRGQDFSSRLAHVGQKDADDIVSVFNSMMTNLKEERLRVLEQNHFLDLLIQASPAGIIILDFDGRIRSANPMAVKIVGEKEMKGRKLSEIETEIAGALADLSPGEEKTVRTGDSGIYRCSCRSFIDKGFKRPFMMIETLSEEVMKAEKEAYGKVIRRMAHEVNNTVAGILPLLETVNAVCDDDELREVTEVCAERSSSLSRFITRYADIVKLPAPVTAPTDLNEMLRAMLPFWESMASGHNVKVCLNESPAPVTVPVDTMLMERVFVNIVKNSVESVSSSGKTDGFVSVNVCAEPVSVTVTDNGSGLSAEASANLFTPFYTSKKDGNGIGLTLVSEILRSHGCQFSLRTSVSDGLTRFVITF